MDTTGLLYPFDPTGASPANLVENERQPINSPGIENFYFILAKAGPFYANDAFEAVLFPSGRVLVEGVDYAFGHEFRAATKSTGIPVYGSIVFYNHDTVGNVRLKYQNVGGTWTLSEQKIAEILTNLTIDPRITTWEQVVDMPVQFPPTAHDWNIADMVGMSEVKDKIGEIADAILASEGEALENHMADKDNPHQTNAEQVGLGLVLNMGLATETAAGLGTSTIGYMNPRLTQVAISRLIRPILDAHMDDMDNPHGTTKGQVGLGNVENYPPATRQEAEAGILNNRYLTPLTGRQLVAAVNALFEAHMIDNGNPHHTTAAQVGAYSINEMTSILTGYLTTTGTAANANRVYGMTMSELLANISQQPMNNALLFNGLSLAEVSTLILNGTASNATKFAGLTKAEFDTSISDMVADKVDGGLVPPVNPVKRLVGEVPDPQPPEWTPTYDIIDLDKSYTKIARVPMRLQGTDVPQDVMFGIAGGRGLASTARPGFSIITVAFDRIVDANNDMVVENVAVMHVNSPAAADTFKLYQQVVHEIEYVEVGDETIEVPQTYLDIWVEDAKLRGPIMCLDYSVGNVNFVTDPFPEFEQDVNLVQPNGTTAITAFRATDAIQTALTALTTRTTALETRAGNIESSVSTLSTNTTTALGQQSNRSAYIEGTLEALVTAFTEVTAEIEAL